MNTKNLNKMQKTFYLIIILFFGTTAVAQTTCEGWGNGVDSIKTRRYYDEYRKLVDSYNYKEALFFWEYVFRKAPSATKNIYLDGVKLYKHFYESEKNTDKKIEYLQKLAGVFDKRATCNPSDQPNILARKALELEKLGADSDMIFQAYKDAAKAGNQEMPSFALVPFSRFAAKLLFEEKISTDEHKAIQDDLMSIAQKNIDNGQDVDNYFAAKVNVRKEAKRAVLAQEDKVRIAESANAKPLSECEQIINAYKKRIKKTPDDELMVSKMINALGNMDCDQANQYRGTLLALQDEKMRNKLDGSEVAARSGNTVSNANFAVKNGDFDKAVELYGQAIFETADADKQAEYHYQIAKIEYAKLDNKKQAKKHLLEVINLQPKNGEAFILLGDVYLAGAKECFPTDNFTQKMVLYASIAKWKKAKEVDASVEDKANHRISKYTNYLPAKSELFLARGRFKGKTYKIGCWINEKVKVKVKF